MTDDRLRRLKEQHHNTNVLDGDLMREAADEILRLRAENEKLQCKLHDATVKYQRLLMQYEPAKAAGLADATFKGDDNVG